MTAKAGARALSFIIVSVASFVMFAAPANAEEPTTTVVPIVPVPIVENFDGGTTTTTESPKLTSNIPVVDPSTKSAPQPLATTAPSRPSVQATTPVVVSKGSNSNGDEKPVTAPVVQAPQIGENDSNDTNVEVTRVTPQMVSEAPQALNAPTEAVTTTSTTAEPAEAQQLTDPTASQGGPDPVWGYLGYGFIGALTALAGYRLNARRS